MTMAVTVDCGSPESTIMALSFEYSFGYSDRSHTVDKQTVCWWVLMHGCSCWLSLHCLELQHRLSMGVQLPLSGSEDCAASRRWDIYYHCIRVTSILRGDFTSNSIKMSQCLPQK